MRKALFAGSFDPFTLGHHAIVLRALALFDALCIGVGVNEQKKTMYTADERVQMIATLYAHEPRITVEAYTDLSVDFALRTGAQFMVRGIRSVKDMEYEMNIADVNRQLAGIESVLLFTEPQYAAISSSLVRELMHFGKDVSAFLPPALQLINR